MAISTYGTMKLESHNICLIWMTTVKVSDLVHTTPEKFERAASFLQLGLHESTPVPEKNIWGSDD